MDLSDRKRIILKAIIQNYMETGEPVGSRTISKFTDLNLSSATIRNEMADLEELGLILQPHTSAGRIPSDQGYRFYVDEILREKETQVSELRQIVTQRVDRIELLLQHVVKILAQNTNYATMISAPMVSKNKLKLIQLSRVDDKTLLAIIVVEGNIVKNSMIDCAGHISDEELLQLNVLVNTALTGLTLEEINLGLITSLKEQAGDYSGVVGSVLEAVAAAIDSESSSQPEIFTSGATNIFKYPELSSGERASEIISAFEEKNQLLELVRNQEEDGIHVYIGQESPVSTMRDCSVVTARYELGEGMQGTVGIIGPKRMDYERVVTTLKTLMEQMDQIYKDNS